jgi:hypothetical protein
MKNPNGPTIEEKEAMQDHLDDLNEKWLADKQLAERDFLDTSIAVWREIDCLMKLGAYPGIPMTADLRISEKAAWERYRRFLTGPAGRASVVQPSPVSEPLKALNNLKCEISAWLSMARPMLVQELSVTNVRVMEHHIAEAQRILDAASQPADAGKPHE